MSHPDALTLLRHNITSHSDIHLLTPSQTKVFTILSSSHISLSTPSGRLPLSKTLPTRYRKPGSLPTADPTLTPEGFYDLQSLLCCYLNRETGLAAYIQDATLQGCAFVTATERKNVADFLEGRLGSGVEPALVVPLSLPSASTVAHQAVPAPSTSTSTSTNPTTTTQTPSSHPAPTSTEPPAKRPRYIVNREDQESVKRIMALHDSRQVADRKSVLRGAKVVSFESVKGLVGERIRGREPIIIISPSSSALINMYNVKRFLEEAVFERPEIVRAQMHNRPAEDVVTITHRRGFSSSSQHPTTTPSSSSAAAAAAIASAKTQNTRFWVVDGVEALSKFGEDPWSRVVCVLTTGQEWQFRPYKWSDPKELFHHVKGFFVQWMHEPPNPKIKGWNVTELRLDQGKRHIDKSAVADFWRNLEGWMALNKPYLM